MTGRQATNIVALAMLGCGLLLLGMAWFAFNYPGYAEAQGAEPIGYHTDLLKGACYTLEANGL